MAERRIEGASIVSRDEIDQREYWVTGKSLRELLHRHG